MNFDPCSSYTGLPVQEIRYTFSVGINWPWPWLFVYFWLWKLPVAWATFLPILMFLGRFVIYVSTNTCQMHRVTLRPWPWRSRRLSLMRVFVLRASACIPSLKLVGIPVRKILGIYCVSINRLVTLIFDLLIFKFALSRPFRSLVMLRHATDGQTNGQTWALIL